jgi:hypothetical protein
MAPLDPHELVMAVDKAADEMAQSVFTHGVSECERMDTHMVYLAGVAAALGRVLSAGAHFTLDEQLGWCTIQANKWKEMADDQDNPRV